MQFQSLVWALRSNGIMTTVNIHASLQRFTNQQGCVQIKDAHTVSALFDCLFAQFGKLKPILFNGDKTLKPHILVYIDNKDLRSVPFDTAIDDQTTIDILTALVGG